MAGGGARTMSTPSMERQEPRIGCRLEATEERPRRAPNPPPATNPGRRSGESTRIHRRKIAKSIALQEETRNSKKTDLLQRGAILQTHHAGVMCPALAAPGTKGLNSWVIRDPIAPQWIWRKIGRGSWWIPGGFLAQASRERAGQSPFVACRPRQSGTGAALGGRSRKP